MNNRVVAVIVAGGLGHRMGAHFKPKQFLYLDGKPIICHTIDRFIKTSAIDNIVVVTNPEWLEETEQIVCKFCDDSKVINIVSGGRDRLESLYFGVNYAVKLGNEDFTIIVSHDGVRPMVSTQIIADNVEVARKGNPCTTAINVVDSLLVSKDGININGIPDRSEFYNIQTPQSFVGETFLKLYEEVSKSDRKTITEATKLFLNNGFDVEIVKGSTENMKITHIADLKIAEKLLEELEG